NRSASSLSASSRPVLPIGLAFLHHDASDGSREAHKQGGKIVVQGAGARLCPHVIIESARSVLAGGRRQQGQYLLQPPFPAIPSDDLESAIAEQIQRAVGWHDDPGRRHLTVM